MIPLLRTTSMITLERDLRKMRQMLDLVHERLGDLNVKAPVDGQLGMLDAEIGQSINNLANALVKSIVLDNFKGKRQNRRTLHRQGGSGTLCFNLNATAPISNLQ